jgi:hypothetical protein
MAKNGALHPRTRYQHPLLIRAGNQQETLQLILMSAVEGKGGS